MSELVIRPANQCRWALASFGEVMLRFDPADRPVRASRCFEVFEGGGEYNVARALSMVFDLCTTHITAIVDNDLGVLLNSLMHTGGVDTSYAKWVPFDGIGINARNGLYFADRGFGVRAAKSTYDRGHSAFSQIKSGDIAWPLIFKEDGVRWFHTGAICAALGLQMGEVIEQAMAFARQSGSVISYDLNFRKSLWDTQGSEARAVAVNRAIVPHVDVLIGNEAEFQSSLGYPVEGLDPNLTALDPANFKKMIERVLADFPNLKLVATTLRGVKTASRNDWGAVMWYDGQFYEALDWPDLEIFDRVGGGDSFVSGLTYGFLAGEDPETALRLGAAHGALAMTTPGDTSMAAAEEVYRVARGGSARMQR